MNSVTKDHTTVTQVATTNPRRRLKKARQCEAADEFKLRRATNQERAKFVSEFASDSYI